MILDCFFKSLFAATEEYLSIVEPNYPCFGLSDIREMINYWTEASREQRNMPTVVVHCQKEDYDVYIGRPSKWGNKFVIGKDGTREEVVKKYREWLLTQPELLDSLRELKGKRLACWCYPRLCHGNVLTELADSLPD
jgi:hypothetical protein